MSPKEDLKQQSRHLSVTWCGSQGAGRTPHPRPCSSASLYHARKPQSPSFCLEASPHFHSREGMPETSRALPTRSSCVPSPQNKAPSCRGVWHVSLARCVRRSESSPKCSLFCTHLDSLPSLVSSGHTTHSRSFPEKQISDIVAHSALYSLENHPI